MLPLSLIALAMLCVLLVVEVRVRIADVRADIEWAARVAAREQAMAEGRRGRLS